MSTEDTSNATAPPNDIPTTVETVLNALSGAGGTVGLVASIGGIALPLGIAVVKKIINSAGGTETVEYQLVLSQTNAELATDISTATADLQQINTELAKLGAAPLAIPGN